MVRILAAALSFFLLTPLSAQQAAPPAAGGPAPESSTTLRGCLQGERGNYVLIEDKTSFVYALKGVGNKLDALLNHEVEAKGKMLYGTVKTGVRPEKAGSNPSDTVHSVDGVPFQIGNVHTDIRALARRCKAADSN